MVAESTPRLATNIVFATVLVSLLLIRLGHFIIRNQDPLRTDIRFFTEYLRVSKVLSQNEKGHTVEAELTQQVENH